MVLPIRFAVDHRGSASSLRDIGPRIELYMLRVFLRIDSNKAQGAESLAGFLCRLKLRGLLILDEVDYIPCHPRAANLP